MNQRTLALKVLGTREGISTAIQETLASPGAFDFLNALREEAVESKAALPARTLTLLNAETSAIVEQYRHLDLALTSMLNREGRLDAYRNYSRDLDPDLPDNPDDLADPAVAFKYGLMLAYRRQFDVSMNEQKAGGWPILMYDLLAPIDGKRTLLVERFPNATANHSDAAYLEQYSSKQAREVAQLLRETGAELNIRLAQALRDENAASVSNILLITPRSAIKAIRAVVEVITTLEAGHIAYGVIKELAEKAEAAAREWERIKQEQQAKLLWDETFGTRGGPRAIEGSSDHVDRFDGNRDTIRGLC